MLGPYVGRHVALCRFDVGADTYVDRAGRGANFSLSGAPTGLQHVKDNGGAVAGINPDPNPNPKPESHPKPEPYFLAKIDH